MKNWIIALALCVLPISVYSVDRLGVEPTQDIAKKDGGHKGGGGKHHGGGGKHHGGGGKHHGGGGKHHGGHHGNYNNWSGYGWGFGPSITYGSPYWYSGYDSGYYYSPYSTQSTYYYQTTPSDDSTYYYYSPQ